MADAQHGFTRPDTSAIRRHSNFRSPIIHPMSFYLTRPCQYIKSTDCQPKYWTSAQFSELTINSIDKAIDHWRGHPINLVGYSGGGAVAMLVAARRNDVISIRTVAGNIDTTTFTGLHHISPLSESMDPAAYADRTAMIPQLHFAGEKDTVVPPSLAEEYQRHLPAKNCSAYIVVPGIDHFSGWPDVWPALLARPLPCAGNNR